MGCCQSRKPTKEESKDWTYKDPPPPPSISFVDAVIHKQGTIDREKMRKMLLIPSFTELSNKLAPPQYKRSYNENEEKMKKAQHERVIPYPSTSVSKSNRVKHKNKRNPVIPITSDLRMQLLDIDEVQKRIQRENSINYIRKS